MFFSCLRKEPKEDVRCFALEEIRFRLAKIEEIFIKPAKFNFLTPNSARISNLKLREANGKNKSKFYLVGFNKIIPSSGARTISLIKSVLLIF